MATKKKAVEVAEWPKVIRGSHSIRTEYEDGRVEFESNWEELCNDVNTALREYEESKIVETVVEKPKRSRKKQ